MTLPKNVADADEALVVDGAPAIWRHYPTIRAHLLNQDAELADADALRDKLAAILTRTADALKGPPAELSLHSWHDLPDVAQELRSRLAAADALLREITITAGQGLDLTFHLQRVQDHLQGVGNEVDD